MKAKKSIGKKIKSYFFKLIIGYILFVMVCTVGLIIYSSEPLGAILVVDQLLVTGPIKRLFMKPISSDEEMVKIFYQHRKSFERLVEIHRNECFYDKDRKKDASEEKRLQELIGIKKLVSSNLDKWVPAPYSQEARQFRKQFSRKISDQSYADITHYCRYGAPKFAFENYSLDYFYKGWIYFPVAPRINGGELLVPGRSYGSLSRYQMYDNLADLNWILRFKLGYSCVYRKIEPQWFLFVCSGKQ